VSLSLWTHDSSESNDLEWLSALGMDLEWLSAPSRVLTRPGKSWKMTLVMESHGIPPLAH